MLETRSPAASHIDHVRATGTDRTATPVRLFDDMEGAEIAELRAAARRPHGGNRA
ncbi:hypothetical protein [Streptomyces sp. CdTB01]|uniref:hypothetical protein n=1 Tax=Streptomyces sp. CdTB01 TaxID=1725411 RepID=UPI000A463CD6|nr:hypothetical protein [Streptomyces sp. CdTB01]